MNKKSNSIKSIPPYIRGETEHFWYRVHKGRIYLHAQRDNKAFGYSRCKVYLSEDCGKTWIYEAPFPEAENITFSCIMSNGNILFATQAELFLSTDNLKIIKPVTVKDIDGSDYRSHSPQISDKAGFYFNSISDRFCWNVKGKEMLVWGNYCNVQGGPAPVNIYYSTDHGKTVKVAYSFGQSPRYQEKDASGAIVSEPLLGNPDNTLFCRHIHSVAYNPEENAFYVSTGDHDEPHGLECHWLRGTYDVERDLWNWKHIISDHMNTRYKSGGVTCRNGDIYWIADCNGPLPHDCGIFRCAPADITVPEKHELLYNPGVMSGCMIVQGDVFLASHCAPASPMDTGIIISTDGGKTWAQYDLKDCGVRSPVRFSEQNSEGWFRVDLRKDWVTFTDEVLFIKPKRA